MRRGLGLTSAVELVLSVLQAPALMGKHGQEKAAL